MERITSRQPIAEALERIPAGLRRRVEHADFLTGVHPNFVGIHYSVARTVYDGEAYDGEAYEGENIYSIFPHVCWTVHQAHLPRARRAPTVVLPTETLLIDVVHELGHVLDEQIGWQRHTPDPVNSYARKHTWEAFAEAFVAYCVPDLAAADERRYVYDLDVAAADAETLALFKELAR